MDCLLTLLVLFVGLTQCQLKQAEGIEKNMGSGRDDMDRMIIYLKDLQKHHREERVIETDEYGDEAKDEDYLPDDPMKYENDMDMGKYY